MTLNKLPAPLLTLGFLYGDELELDISPLHLPLKFYTSQEGHATF